MRDIEWGICSFQNPVQEGHQPPEDPRIVFDLPETNSKRKRAEWVLLTSKRKIVGEYLFGVFGSHTEFLRGLQNEDEAVLIPSRLSEATTMHRTFIRFA
ncbi:hypothetical protein CNECB9_930016 [Cupriavidus necator]|uniref:Uncharacterized protein n=1 Tax=Cupriavidus necator TaxID=106590 RepID=A0A1K0JRT3_CUPNE|nr:hypothetical protein CNECB9_930016 [Cupriavidus necator]